MFARKLFTRSNRWKAWHRWNRYQLQLSWLIIATGSPGDFYWSDGTDELRRRGLVDAFDRITRKGWRAQGRARAAHPMWRKAA